jgi:hypothetical protein
MSVVEPTTDVNPDRADVDLEAITRDLRRSVARVAEFTRRAGTAEPATVDLLDAAYSAERTLLALDQISSSTSPK